MSNAASFSVSLAIEREYYQPEIVIDPRDQSTPLVYFPFLPLAEAEKLPQNLIDAAWEAYDADDPMADTPTYEEDQGADTNGVEYIRLNNDDGRTTLRRTPELKLARFGRQVVRVYGPESYSGLAWRLSFTYDDQNQLIGEPEWLKWEEDIPVRESFIVYHSLDIPSKEADDGAYGMNPIREANDCGYLNFDSNKGRFAASTPAGKREGRFVQLSEKDKGDAGKYHFKFKFGNKEFKRTYIISGNRAEYRAGTQARRIGRKVTMHREVLNFSNSTEQTIKYWYDDPVVTVLSWTRFIDANGKVLDVRPINYAQGDVWWNLDWEARIAASNGYRPKAGRTFRSSKPVWGSLLIEYPVAYTEYEIFYDFPTPRREYEVQVGTIERVGFVVKDYKDDTVVNQAFLEGSDIGYDYQKKDKDWIRANKKKSDFSYDNAPDVYLKLMRKVQFKPFKSPSLEFFYNNGKRVATTRWTPPSPEFMDLCQDEMPKITIMQERKRFRRYGADASTNDEGYVEFERVVENVAVDPMGNVYRSRYEDQREDEDNRPETD